MVILTDELVSDLLDRAFAEDLGEAGDITGLSTIAPETTLTAVMNAREPLVAAGLPIAVAAFKRLDPVCRVTQKVQDGEAVRSGAEIMRIEGNARALLAAERTALNTVQHLSGIATLTRAYVNAMDGTDAKLLDTRKTLPGLRMVEKYATRMGGAVNHRVGLFDAVMIKDNHIAVGGGVERTVTAARNAGHSHIQVECDTLDQVIEAISAGATSLLLDNMGPEMLRAALNHIPETVTTEASGGVTLDTIRALAETGVQYISVGRITQSAPAIDIGLDYA